jgi:microcystin-dependent protein
LAQPYIGEIRMFAGNFAPLGWAFCDGSLVEIANPDYETLFNLIGTTYGGDGESTFALPDLRGRVPMHQGNGYLIGELGGVETVTLTTQQIPNHQHSMVADQAAGTTGSPQNAQWAESGLDLFLQNPTSTQPMSPKAIQPAGGSQPHENMAPFLGVNFIISLFGVFPTP